MFRRIFPFFVSIKSRLFLSFLLLVLLFILNGAITLFILHKNSKLANHVATVVDPTTQTLIRFNQMLIESRMLSSNWVFIRSNEEDKAALLKIHSTLYPHLKRKLDVFAPRLFNNAVNDSLNQVYVNFNKLIDIEKVIISKLNSFESYDNAFIRMEMEMKVEDEIIPGTAALLNSMSYIIHEEQQIREEAHLELEKSNTTLEYVLMSLSFIVIVMGALLSVYLVRIITNPIHQLRGIIMEMGRGKLEKIDYKEKENEIGLMVASVNHLSENLSASANFAMEIGRRNFSTDFKPLSSEDTLGKALITMRDNLKESDYRLNQAQNIAKLGSWEFDLNSFEIIWSDELFNILGFKPRQIKPSLNVFMEMVMEEYRPIFREILKKGLTNDVYKVECKILSSDNVLKDLYVQGQTELDEKNNIVKILGIVQDITIKKQAEEELKRNNAELMKTNKELDKFVYSVSHDLRSPLSSMLGIVQLTEEDCEDPFIKDNLNLVKGSILKLDGFIQDILAYSRNARLDVRTDEINFNELVFDITGSLKHMTEAKRKINFITHIEQPCQFKSDFNRIKIILNNLISNAVRYSDPSENEPFIKVDTIITEKEACITIADNGIGIRKDLHQKIFDMFYRVSENSVGSGLGLYIVKETIEKLHGNIQIESEPGVGTKFYLTLPNAVNDKL